MDAIVKVYTPLGGVRAVYSDAVADREEAVNELPTRASRIETIKEGPKAGKWCVDFTLLAEAEDRPELACCLWPPFDRYGTANRAEIDWLHANWVDPQTSSDLAIRPGV